MTITRESSTLPGMISAWQQELKEANSSAKDLTGFAFPISLEVENRFRTLIPRYYLNLIDPNDPQDPIAMMALPAFAELSQKGLRDPIGDLSKKVVPRLTHRYPDRALLHVTNLCPMYCRFCFRKNLMNEKEGELYSGDFEAAYEYLSAHPEIKEVILTGGDPWMLSDEKLNALVDALALRAPQVKRLRFHTRMPVTLPSRITDGLLEVISRKDRFQTIVVTHFNHPRELSGLAAKGMGKLRSAGILVLNQSVLLKGVNDSTKILQELFIGLGNLGALPYYLHHCDRVAGGEHFRTSFSVGKKIISELRGKIPGYFIPEYVLDQPGGLGKIPVSSLRETSKGKYLLSDGSVYEDIEGGN